LAVTVPKVTSKNEIGPSSVAPTSQDSLAGGSGLLHHYFSEFFDRNGPPLFKNILLVDATATEPIIRSFATTTACLEHEQDPPVEDHVKIKLEQ
jgi:hypothetical protein